MYVRVVTESEPVPSMPEEPALKTKYEPDRFQKFAIQAIEAGENVLITAKTGSGKTFVGEYQIAKTLSRGGRVFYTTPIKSLSNQKFHDLKELFPEASVGIMTGDIKFRPDAQIIVMTTEILRNLLFKQGSATEKVGATALVSLEGLDAVVFDEVHYINDPDRGHVWEETLMLLPPHIKLILLSATLSSPYNFARWLGESKKTKVWLISTLWRAVPLEHCVIQDGKPMVIYDAKENFNETTYRAWVLGKDAGLLAHDKFKEKVKDARRGGHEGPVEGKTRPKAFEHQMNDLLEYLHTHGNLPAIFFVFSRAGCEKLAKKTQGTFLDSSDSALVAHIWDFHLSRFKDGLEKSPQYHALRELAMRGIAFHHSGLLPFLKEILEILFSKGLVKLLFATETFAVGINMPTKTVVFTSLDKYSDGGNRLLRSSEYTQMAGRAGRRGKDDRGLVIYLPQREPLGILEMKQILTGRSATFGSRMDFHYDFVLKVLNHADHDMSSLIENSYWFALQKEEMDMLKKEIVVAETSVISMREDELADCRLQEELVEKVSTLQNAKKKAAQRELEAWHAEHRESVWKPVLERYKMYKNSIHKVLSLKGIYDDSLRQATVPSVQLRLSLLAEYGYVDQALGITPLGRLASEVNEGHPFLMTELFLRIRSQPWDLSDLLILLAVFLGDSPESKPVSQLDVSAKVYKEIQQIYSDAKIGCEREDRLRIVHTNYWDLSNEWIEPIQRWVTGEDILPVVAAEFDIFEGNLQRALLKLMGLVDEFRALATLAAEPKILEVLEGAQEIVLRDVVMAESLYLRL